MAACTVLPPSVIIAPYLPGKPGSHFVKFRPAGVRSDQVILAQPFGVSLDPSTPCVLYLLSIFVLGDVVFAFTPSLHALSESDKTVEFTGWYIRPSLQI